jgi:hypothetical protein
MSKRRFVMPRAFMRDPVKEARVAELLRAIDAFRKSNRSVPGHILRAVIKLAPYWHDQVVPSVVIDAKARLARAGR